MLSFSLFVTFGLTWIIGFLLFLTIENSEPLAYVFTILNSLQGKFLYQFFSKLC